MRFLAHENVSRLVIERLRADGFEVISIGESRSGATDKDVLCVHDVKTGEAGLRAARAVELASTVQYFYPGTQRIIVTEVRPGR